MSDDKLIVQDEQNLPVGASTDRLLQMANMAEQRIGAIKKIKSVALALTNANDWVDQQGKPYLQASGSEKIAGAFDISWEFLTLEPAYEEDPDGHYTYTYHGKFSMAGRTIHIDGSRSSNDGFFNQYDYPEGKPKKKKPVNERTNKRDVKMAALTNLLGNGITRLLGIRNLTYADLEKFASIKKDMLGKVEYKSDKPPIKQPEEKKSETKKPTGEIISEPQRRRVFAISKTANVSEGDMKVFLDAYGFKSSKEITKNVYKEICEKVESGNIETPMGDMNIFPGCTKDVKTCDHSEMEGDKFFCQAQDGKLCQFEEAF